MERFAYTVLLVPEGSGYVVHVPALPGCVTQGESIEDALEMAEDAIRVWLRGETPQPEPDGIRALTSTVTVEVEVIDGRIRPSGVVAASAMAGARR